MREAIHKDGSKRFDDGTEIRRVVGEASQVLIRRQQMARAQIFDDDCVIFILEMLLVAKKEAVRTYASFMRNTREVLRLSDVRELPRVLCSPARQQCQLAVDSMI